MDIGIVLAVIVTVLPCILLLYSTLNTNWRKDFINTVTAERIKWLDKLRNDLSQFRSHVFVLSHQELSIKERNELLGKLTELHTLLTLRLNRLDEYDSDVINQLDIVFNHAKSGTYTTAYEKTYKLINLAQDMLKAEWEKVKDESIKGRLKQDKNKTKYSTKHKLNNENTQKITNLDQFGFDNIK